MSLSKELNCIIFRPYSNILKTVESLSLEHLTLMKFNSSRLLMMIAQAKGWHDFNIEVDYDNPTFKYYYNNGKPYYHFLLEYYTEVFIKSVKSGGGEIDLAGIYDRIYDKHRQECCMKPCWSVAMSVNHRLFLLKYDHKWYKRKYRKHRSSNLENYRFYDCFGFPIGISISDIKGKIYEEDL